MVRDALTKMTSLHCLSLCFLLSINHPVEMEIAVHQLIIMLFMGASEQTQRKNIDHKRTTSSLFQVNMCIMQRSISCEYVYVGMCVFICVCVCAKIHSLLTIQKCEK